MLKLRYLIKFLGYFSLCIIIGWLVYINKNAFIDLYLKVEFSQLWPLLLLQIPLIAMNGLPFKTLCLPLGFTIRWQDWAGLSYIGNFLNQVLPFRPGLGVRFFYLNKKYHITLQQFIYVSMAYLLLTCSIATLLVGAAWSFGSLPLQHPFQITYIIFGLFSFVILLTINKLKSTKLGTINPKSGKNFSLLTIVSQIFNNAQFIFKAPKILIQSGIILLCANILTVITFYGLFMALNAPLPLGHCAFLVGLTTLAMLYPLTPGNIGITESIIGGITQTLYGDFSLGFSAIAVYRGCQLIISLTFGSVFGVLLLNNRKSC